jgi:hypothetical protein
LILPVLLILALTMVTGAGLLASESQAALALQPSADLQWEVVWEPPAGQTNPPHWYTISFPTSSVGYVSGGPDWNENNGSGQVTVAKTTDGGRSWSTALVPQTTRFMRGLACKDENTCWLAGASNPKIRYTTDGGATWGIGNPAYNYAGWYWSAGYTGNESTALLGTTGYFTDEPNRAANLLRSTNGVTFNQIVFPNQDPFVQWDFSCPEPGTCYSIAKGRAHRSTDDGASWRRRIVTSLNNSVFYGISCPDVDSCWAVGESRLVAFTRDGGSIWTPASVEGVSGARPRFWNVHMVDAQQGYAVGCTNAESSTETCSGEAMIFRTNDGVLWNRITFPGTADVMDVYAHSTEEVIVVDWEGKIWRGEPEATPTPTATDTPTPTATPTATPTIPSIGAVAGVTFEDSNGDLLFNGDDQPVGGAVLALRQGDLTRYQTTSATDGTFEFPEVEPGQYTLQELSPPLGLALNRSIITFQITAGHPWTFYIPHGILPYYIPMFLRSSQN